jgi:hypothetical protein
VKQYATQVRGSTGHREGERSRELKNRRRKRLERKRAGERERTSAEEQEIKDAGEQEIKSAREWKEESTRAREQKAIYREQQVQRAGRKGNRETEEQVNKTKSMHKSGRARKQEIWRASERLVMGTAARRL